MYSSNQYMNQAKRQLSVEMSWEADPKKLRTSDENKYITSIEDLSNELIYEIFDYLNTGEIFDTFSNLNQRFENLIIHSNLPLKVHHSTSSKQSFELYCLRMIIPNKHRIRSFHLSSRSELIQFFTLHTIDSSFHRLESLILHGIQSNEIISLLPSLTTLPRLFSLNISLHDNLSNLNEIYRLIFRLPMLKSYEISAKKSVLQDSMSIFPIEQFSSIEKLVINHPCTLHGLYDLLSCTPKLRRLTCDNLFQLNSNLLKDIPLRRFNLTHCFIRNCYLTFDQFEIFIQKISSQLRVLRFTSSSDIAYLDADRWERLICQSIPYLHTFILNYSDLFFDRLVYQLYHSIIHRFTSLFWIEKGWILDIQVDSNYWLTGIIYSIQPYKKQWYDEVNDQNKNIQQSMNVSKAISQLTIRNCHVENSKQYSMDYIRCISTLAKITSLHIELNYFSLEILAQFFYLLPHLDSLTIVFRDLNPIEQLTEKQMKMIHAASEMNKITKLNIEQVVNLNQVDILMNLCPQIEYLQVKCRNDINLESLIRLILMKKESNLSSVCFWISLADDSMVKELQAMIDFEKLRVNYTIQRFHERIYLQRQRYC